MKREEENEIRTTIERTGGRVSETGEVKRFTYRESVDSEGTVHKTTEVEKGMNDCGHYDNTGAVCQLCQSFSVCESCARTERFVCDNCKRICCPNCSVESIFHPGKRFCDRCGFRGLLREALKERK
jgi:hypothetical protein